MFGEKRFTGVGYPTPVSIPDDTTCLMIQVPASDEWWGLMVGVLYTLTLEWNWQQYEGGLDRDVAAAAWQVMFDQAIDIAAVSNECSLTVPAPYWDDTNGDDADDEEPINDQEWYGELDVDGITWKERVGIWAITAFVAIAATPAAAIAFLPIANRFALAFHQHDLGGIVRVLIDGVEMATVDTYAPTDGVISVPIALSPSMGLLEDVPPQMLIVMSEDVNPAVDGTPNIQVIRQRLAPDQVTPKNLRYDTECDCVQQTPDDGTTWIDTPQADPRHGDGFRLPARTSTDPQCDAAANMTVHIQATFDAIIGSSSALQAANAVFGVFSLFFFEFGIVIDAILAVVSAIFAVGTSTLEGALTSDVYDQLLCIIFCNINLDGTVTADQYDAIYNQVDTAPAPMAGTAASVIKLLLSTWGEVELSNAGARGEEVGDCSACTDCQWCYRFDVAHQLDTWIPETFGSATATYSSGAWHSGNSGGTQWLWIAYTFGSPITLTDAALLTVSPGTTPRSIFVNGDGTAPYSGGTLIWQNGAIVGTPFPISVDRIDVFIGTAGNGTPNELSVMQFSGSDAVNPFGDNNC